MISLKKEEGCIGVLPLLFNKQAFFVPVTLYTASVMSATLPASLCLFYKLAQ
jgi:hypothetical protein